MKKSLVITVIMSMATNVTPEKMKSGLDVHVANGSMNRVANVVVCLRTNISFAKTASEPKTVTVMSLS